MNVSLFIKQKTHLNEETVPEKLNTSLLLPQIIWWSVLLLLFVVHLSLYEKRVYFLF